jgi:two-component system invasion response regulator UvrY
MMDKDKTIHIAYAEDHISVREGIVAALERSGGFSVDIQADNGIDLLEQLARTMRLPDICIVDINMPKMNGFNLIIELKKRWPAMPALILTLFENESYIIKMIQNGANGYLLKSCPTTEIRNAIQSILETGFYYSKVADSDKFASVNNKTLKPFNLTTSEIEFLKYSCSDLNYSEIATKMNTTTRSIEGYRDRLFSKLKVNSRVSLAMYAIKSGLVTIEAANYLNLNNK